MDKKDLKELDEIDENRITKTIIPKYENEDFSASAHRVYIDGKETKFCFCSTCNCYFSADRKHLVSNIRSHFNSHASRKRTQKSTLESFFQDFIKKEKNIHDTTIQVSDIKISYTFIRNKFYFPKVRSITYPGILALKELKITDQCLLALKIQCLSDSVPSTEIWH